MKIYQETKHENFRWKPRFNKILGGNQKSNFRRKPKILDRKRKFKEDNQKFLEESKKEMKSK